VRSCTLPLGVALGLIPLALFNYQTFGAALPPTIPAAYRTAIAVHYLTGNANEAKYNPEPIHISSEQLRDVRKQRTLANLKDFLLNARKGSIFSIWLFPFIWCAICRIVHQCGTRRESYLTSWNLFGVFSVLMCAGGLLLPTIVVFESRYWNFLVPLGCVLAYTTMQQLSRALIVFAIAWQLVAGLQHYVNLEHKRVPNAYDAICSVVPPESALLVEFPNEVSFHTRRKCVALPYTDKDDVLIDLARRYNTQYLAIVGQPFHPWYNHFLDGSLPPYVNLVHQAEDVIIARFSPDLFRDK
jgi:hypothetical protein